MDLGLGGSKQAHMWWKSLFSQVMVRRPLSADAFWSVEMSKVVTEVNDGTPDYTRLTPLCSRLFRHSEIMVESSEKPIEVEEAIRIFTLG